MSRLILLIGLVTGLLSPAPALALAAGLPDCESLAEAAGAGAGTPPGLMTAIARVESGRTHQGRFSAWPWTLNQGGRGSYHESQADAMQQLSLILASGVTNVDIGCMQVNWRWHRQNFDSAAAMMDPVQNTRYAARHLAELYDRHGDWTQAVAAYHAGDPGRGRAYQAKVAAAHRALGQQPAPFQPAAFQSAAFQPEPGQPEPGQPAPYYIASDGSLPETPNLPEGGVWIDAVPEILGSELLVADDPMANMGFATNLPAAPQVARLQGILATPQGHLLAVGSGGDLRQRRATGFGMPSLSRAARFSEGN